MPYNFLIIDDHIIVRSGIKALIRDHFDVGRLDEASKESEIISKVKATAYDLIVLDINIPGSNFITIMDWLKNTSPETHIIVFTMYAEDIYGARCLKLGAKGFLHKGASNDIILAALKKVLEGGIYITDGLKKILAQPKQEKAAINPFDKLSERELEIALLVNKGHSLPDICSLLNIQYSTANNYKRRMFEKLNISNVADLSNLMHTFKVEG